MAAQEVAHHAANGEEPGSSALAARTIPVCLKDFEAETRCAVCLGIVKDCRLVSGCMHRFCSECIEKWLRVASEPACPQCRMQMQSRRDCKRDSRFDRLMQQLYGDLQGFEAQRESALEDPLVTKGRQLGRQLASALEAQRAKRAVPSAEADKLKTASAPAGSAAILQQAKRKAKAESPAPRQDSSSAGQGASNGKGTDSKASKEAKAGKERPAKRVRHTAPRSQSPAHKKGLAEEELEAMQLAAELAAKAAEARQKEAERIRPVVQVTVSLPSPKEAGSEPGKTLHMMVPSKATAAQLLQAIKGVEGVSCAEGASLQIRNPLKKSKASEKSPSNTLQLEKTLGWAASRLKSCKEDLHLHLEINQQ